MLVREAGDRPESVHSKPTPLAVTKYNSYVESREFIHSLDGKEREPGSEVGFWTSRVLKIFLLGFRIQSEILTPDLLIWQWQRIHPFFEPGFWNLRV